VELQRLTSSIIKNKKVLVRADLDVPLEEKNGKLQVADDNRLQLAKDTITFITEHQGVCILIGHLGRPEKKDPQKSFKPVANHLSQLLNQPVIFIDDCIGDAVQKQIEHQPPGSVIVLENLRYYSEEQANDAHFAKQLASLADVYVNEAFSTSHRTHASIVGIPTYLPAYAGFNLAKEVETFSNLMTKPKRPFVMIVGGAKISDKVEAIEHLTSIADVVLVGGGVANNFLKADGFDVQKSYLQDTPADLKKKGTDYIEAAAEMIHDTKQDRLLKDGYIPLPKIIYPIDVIAATSPKSKSGKVIELVNGNHHEATKKGLMYLDIGPKTIKLFQEIILQAGTVFWNGPMGVFENKAFANGTREIGQTVAKATATTILGGGDTIGAINDFKLNGRFDYVSGAGGAALEFLSGKMLPGIKPLLKRKS